MNWASQITRWWDLTADYLEKNSTKLGDAVQKVLKATATENPFPEGMDMDWALDVQSAQTLDFFAGMQQGKVAWDLGTLTGVSAAVLSQHMNVTTVEREACLVKFARKHLPENVDVVQSEIEAFLRPKLRRARRRISSSWIWTSPCTLAATRSSWRRASWRRVASCSATTCSTAD